MKDSRKPGAIRSFRGQLPYARPYAKGILAGLTLILVADAEEVVLWGSERLDDQLLGRLDVLVLVYEDAVVLALPVGARVGVAT